ncbi:hypothetical protein Tco_1204206 [Tanacetum coccineum]
MSQIDGMDSTNAKCCRALLVLVYKDTNDDPESDVRIVKRRNTDTGTPVDSSSVQDPIKYKNVGVSDGVWANRNLHSYSSPSTSVSTKRFDLLALMKLFTPVEGITGTYFSFGRHLDELHANWAHLEKKTDKTTDQHQDS